jgi:hypothetical protein
MLALGFALSPKALVNQPKAPDPPANFFRRKMTDSFQRV